MRETVRKFKETVEIRSSVFNRVRSHRYFPATMLFLVFLTAACVHVWQRVKVVELVKDVSQLRQENSDLIDAKKKLHSEIAALSTASRIEKYATDTLGLMPVAAERLFTLVPKSTDFEQTDDLQLMLYAISRVASNVPRISENSAMAKGVDNLSLDTLAGAGGGR